MNLRHLKNINELVVYASISCIAAFLGRLFPAFYFPILLLRLGVFGYCFYIISRAEGNKELAVIISGALFIGLIGGYWDLIEIYLRYKQTEIGMVLTLLIAGMVLAFSIILNRQAGDNGKTR